MEKQALGYSSRVEDFRAICKPSSFPPFSHLIHSSFHRHPIRKSCLEPTIFKFYTFSQGPMDLLLIHRTSL